MNSKIYEPDIVPTVDSEQPERRRTALIWLIVTSIWIIGIFSVIGFIRVWLRSSELQIQQQMGVQILRIGTIVDIIDLIIIAIQVVAAWYLFMLRSRAIKVFAVALGLSIASDVLLIDPNYRDYIMITYSMGMITFTVYSFIYYLLCVAIILYMLKLRRRSVLR